MNDSMMADAEWQVRWRECIFSIAAAFVRWPTNWGMGAPILLYHRVVGRRLRAGRATSRDNGPVRRRFKFRDTSPP